MGGYLERPAVRDRYLVADVKPESKVLHAGADLSLGERLKDIGQHGGGYRVARIGHGQLEPAAFRLGRQPYRSSRVAMG